MKRTFDGLLARGPARFDRRQAQLLGLWVPGLLGLLALGRTAVAYGTNDLLALGLVILMTAGFVTALVELTLRLRRAFRVADEVQALPVPATEEAVEATSPELRAYLRARIENGSAPGVREGFTGYLIGLMVMLGLLGTLLGLFDALRGAGSALAESANVDALRAGLSNPMHGLTRSFGCSAAGVTASALLGLCSVLVRRAESHSLFIVARYANGPLRELSPTRKQLAALAQIAEHGEAWPRAASALGQVSAQLAELATRWEAAHSRAAQDQRTAFAAMTEGVRKEFASAAADLAKHVEVAVQPLVAQSVTQAGEASLRHLQGLSATLERDQSERRASDEMLRTALRSDFEALSAALSRDQNERRTNDESLRSALRHEMAELRAWSDQEIAARVSEQDARLQTFESALRQSSAAVTELMTRSSGALDELMARIASQAERSAAGLAEQARADAAALAELTSRVGTLMDRNAQELAARAQTDAAALAELTGRVGTLLDRNAEELAQHAQTNGRQAEQIGQALTALHELSETLRDSLSKQEEAIHHLLAEAATQLAQAGGSAQAEAREALERVVSLATEQAERLSQFEGRLLDAQTGHAEALSKELGAFAERLSQGLGNTSELVREASSVLKASSVEMGTVAELFSESVDRQRDAARTWMESLGDLEGAVERAGRGAAAEALNDQLASTQEVFARQLQFQRELFEQLRTLRAAPAPTRTERADVSA